MKAVTETQSRLFNYVGDGGMTIYNVGVLFQRLQFVL